MRQLLNALLILALLASAVPCRAAALFAMDLRPGEDPRRVAAGTRGISRWIGLGTTLVLESDDALPERIPGRITRRLDHPANSRLALVLTKHQHDTAHDPFPGVILARHAGVALAAMSASMAGAAADPHLQLREVPWNSVVVESAAPRRGKGSPDPVVDEMVSTAVGSLIRKDIQTLVDFKSRHTLSAGYREAAAWCEAQLQAAGLTTRRVPFSISGRSADNVVAEIAGQPGVGDVYVIGAHLDSIAFEGGMQQAPGADDNASGTACVIAIARAFAGRKPRATLRFMLFGGEEEGLVGSTSYVESLSQTERQRIKGALILDMTAFHKGAQIGLMLEGRSISTPLADAVADAANRYTQLKVERTLEAWGSDHIPFLDAGIPALLTFELDYPENGNQHTLRDVMELVDAEQAAAIARADIAALAVVTGLSSRSALAGSSTVSIRSALAGSSAISTRSALAGSSAISIRSAPAGGSAISIRSAPAGGSAISIRSAPAGGSTMATR